MAEIKEKILLVDDEPGIRKVLGISLEASGYQVLKAENGQEALSIFQKEAPPIVLTDIKMPGMDGIDVLRRIKAENPDTEVIVITGHGDMDLAIKSLKYEATDFITKPIDDDELERALGKARKNIEARSKLKKYTENLENMVQQKSERLSALLDAKSGDQSAYQHFFDEIPGYVLVVDKAFRIRAVNRQVKTDFRYQEEGKNFCYSLLKNRKTPCIECPASMSFTDGKTHQQENEYLDIHGDRRRTLTWTSPVKGEGGGTERVMVMSTDLTQIEELKEHLSSLGLMVGSASHGIKGLLTGLDGGVYMLDSGLNRNDPEKITEGVDMVKLMAGRIKNMVLDILYYSKERDLNYQDVSIPVFMKNTAKVVGPEMADKGIRFEKKVDPELEEETFRLDPEQLQLALVNLLENAVDACLEDDKKSGHRISFTAKKEGENLVFAVKDNGTGMDEKTKEKIFTLFYSSKSSRGTGIGLFITQKIVTRHKGEIMLESAPGEGATFQVCIPAYPRENGKNGREGLPG